MSKCGLTCSEENSFCYQFKPVTPLINVKTAKKTIYKLLTVRCCSDNQYAFVDIIQNRYNQISNRLVHICNISCNKPTYAFHSFLLIHVFVAKLSQKVKSKQPGVYLFRIQTHYSINSFNIFIMHFHIGTPFVYVVNTKMHELMWT